jgi:hypothetical protein
VARLSALQRAPDLSEIHLSFPLGRRPQRGLPEPYRSRHFDDMVKRKAANPIMSWPCVIFRAGKSGLECAPAFGACY